MDDVLNDQEDGQYVRRPAIRAALANANNQYVDLLQSVFNVPPAVIRYVRTHWYNPNLSAPEVWWKDKQPIEPVVRRSLIEAIDVAGDLPIDSYWMTVGHRNVDWRYVPLGTYRTDEYPFEIILMKSETQLTRLIITPPSPRGTRLEERFTEPSDIWVVKSTREPLPLGDIRMEDGLAVINLYEQPYPRRNPNRS